MVSSLATAQRPEADTAAGFRLAFGAVARALAPPGARCGSKLPNLDR
jgi:hypothetical protein